MIKHYPKELIDKHYEIYEASLKAIEEILSHIPYLVDGHAFYAKQYLEGAKKSFERELKEMKGYM